MASSISTSFPASFPAAVKGAANSPHYCNSPLSNLSFQLSPWPRLRFFTKDLHCSQNSCVVVRGQMNEVSFYQWFSFEDLVSNISSFLDNFFGSSVAFKVDDSSNTAATPPPESGEPAVETQDSSPSSDVPPASATEESISEFLTQVSGLVKLVDSRDIVELHLKQLDCELTIRKRVALPQPPPSAPAVMMHPPSTLPSMPPAPTPSASAPSAPAAPSTPAAPKSAKSMAPTLKCPMAGTFYRCPGPGQPPFVKIGDKVQKGQVLCIIEAMKLMNEIEADRSGTLVEILVEDAKPVSVGQPLFVIEP